MEPIRKIFAVIALSLCCLGAAAQVKRPSAVTDAGLGIYSTGDGEAGLSFDVSLGAVIPMDRYWTCTPAVTVRAFANELNQVLSDSDDFYGLGRVDISAEFRRRLCSKPLPVNIGIGPWCGWLVNKSSFYNETRRSADDGRRYFQNFGYGIMPSIDVRVNDVLTIGVKAALDLPHFLHGGSGGGPSGSRHMNIFNLTFAVDLE